jgi:protein SCO1
MCLNSTLHCPFVLAALVTAISPLCVAWSAQSYQATGLVLKLDRAQQMITVSEDSIPGYMEAMVMSYRVREPQWPPELKTGAKIAYILTVNSDSSSISKIRVLKFDSVARDPLQVRTLALLESALSSNGKEEHTQGVGETVPDFALTDQNGGKVMLSQFRGKLVAITFVYTRCPLPDYCLRLSNNFGQLQRRFGSRLGRELILLSITFDPVHDAPEILSKYASIWQADTTGWRFLTGSLEQIKRVCADFGMQFWPDEGLLTHSLHTVLIDREGKLVANLEGNQFTAQQLGDLVEVELAGRR